MSRMTWINERRLLALAVAASLVLHAAALVFGPRLRHEHRTEAPPLMVEILPAPKLIPPAVEPDPPPPSKAVPVAKAVAPPPEREPVRAVPRREEAPAAPVAPIAERKAEADSEHRAEPPQETRAAAPSDPAPGATVASPGLIAAYLRTPPPRYPASALRRGEEGTVMLKVLVTAEGIASTVELEKSSGSATLDNAAREAAKGWRFVPARRGADPVEAWVLVPVVFRLEGRG